MLELFDLKETGHKHLERNNRVNFEKKNLILNKHKWFKSYRSQQ